MPASPIAQDDDDTTILQGDFLPVYDVGTHTKQSPPLFFFFFLVLLYIPEATARVPDQPDTNSERYYISGERYKEGNDSDDNVSVVPIADEAATVDLENRPPSDISAWLNVVIMVINIS